MSNKKQADRFNEGKLDLTLIPPQAAAEEARVWEKGAEKYSRDNWKKLWGKDTVQTVLASLLRHAHAIQMGEDFDKESGCLHAAHIRCNAAMLIEYSNTCKESEEIVDDLVQGTEFVAIEYTNYQPFFGGSTIGHRIVTNVAADEVNDFILRHPDSVIIKTPRGKL